MAETTREHIEKVLWDAFDDPCGPMSNMQDLRDVYYDNHTYGELALRDGNSLDLAHLAEIIEALMEGRI